jgi:hypothetical protein
MIMAFVTFNRCSAIPYLGGDDQAKDEK